VAEVTVRSGLRGFKPQNLANTVWAFATAGVRADALYAAVAEAAVRSGLRGFKPQALANTVWAFATADQYHPALLSAIACALRSPASASDFEDCYLAQLHQVHLWLSLERPGGPSTLTFLPDSALRARCQAAMKQMATHARVSSLQSSVSAQLARLRSGSKEEWLEPHSGYSIDIALPASRVAIEVDGPSHFVSRCRGEHAPNGATLLKQRLLKAAGWCVVSVPYYEWDRLTHSDTQLEYLERKLSAAGVPM